MLGAAAPNIQSHQKTIMKLTRSPKFKKEESAFAQDVTDGLLQHPKQLPSKYFYDAKGDQLFQDIMNMPEYYLTDCELDILQNQKDTILKLIGEDTFDLVELGAGDGTKTKVLLEHFLAQQADFCYSPIDISGNVLQHLKHDLQLRWPQLCCEPLQGDYFKVLKDLALTHEIKKVILFLGANIGNFTSDRAEAFLEHVGDYMRPDDLLIVGFDLKKDPEVILDAYNDPAGITAAFNLNLLERINRELGADFQLDQFKHWETYDPITGATRSFIVSTKDQEVRIEALGQAFHFNAWEAINVELSQKYDIPMIEQLAEEAGFEVLEHLFDDQKYFVDSVWRKK
jgi:dimethylhistidine N-methyltransferase